MIIDNEKRIIKNRIRKIILALISLCLSVFFAINEGNIIKGKILGLTTGQLAIIIASAYFIYIIIIFYLEPFYIFYSDENNNLIFRYYSTIKINPIKQVIDIPKNEFLYCKIKTDFSGIKKKIILYRKTKHGIAKYPALCLSFLSNKEINNLLASLSKYQQIE
jgi:hypothetical protein